MAGPREIRIDGGTVRRPRMPWTPTVHDLLDHLSTQGIPVPRPLSIDDHIESVSLVPGLAGDDVWPDGLSATICHGDPKPANVAWRNEVAVGLFDWDAARPGDPAEDVAYALLWVTPIEVDPGDEPLSKHEITLRRARARALLDGYGWEGSYDVVEAAESRHEQAIDEVEWLGSHGHEPHATWVAQGWPISWRSRLNAMREAGRRTFPAPLPG